MRRGALDRRPGRHGAVHPFGGGDGRFPDAERDPGADTAAELARFIQQQDAGENALDLCQGILCHPRELTANRLVWLADAIRPACDMSLFAATTGTDSPRAGPYGELLMVRASVEAAIGWDFTTPVPVCRRRLILSDRANAGFGAC